MRGRLIGALGTVSDKIANIDQVAKSTDVMSSVVAKPSEVKDSDKVSSEFCTSFNRVLFCTSGVAQSKMVQTKWVREKSYFFFF
jgi:hypothetical protein